MWYIVSMAKYPETQIDWYVMLSHKRSISWSYHVMMYFNRKYTKQADFHIFNRFKCCVCESWAISVLYMYCCICWHVWGFDVNIHKSTIWWLFCRTNEFAKITFTQTLYVLQASTGVKYWTFFENMDGWSCGSWNRPLSTMLW